MEAHRAHLVQDLLGSSRGCTTWDGFWSRCGWPTGFSPYLTNFGIHMESTHCSVNAPHLLDLDWFRRKRQAEQHLMPTDALPQQLSHWTIHHQEGYQAYRMVWKCHFHSDWSWLIHGHAWNYHGIQGRFLQYLMAATNIANGYKPFCPSHAPTANSSPSLSICSLTILTETEMLPVSK